MKRSVQDVMTRTVVVVSGSAPFKEIVRLMREYRVSALPVVDDDGTLVGIVTEGDLLLKEDPDLREPPGLFEAYERRVEREKARGLVAAELMTTPVVTIRADASVAEAARLMHDRRIKRLPVVERLGKVIGIVSRRDLLKLFTRPDSEIEHTVARDVIGREIAIEPGAVRVRVRDGVVLLEGQVERKSLVPTVVERVHEVEGVIGVESRLSYREDDGGDETPTTPPSMFDRFLLGSSR